MILDTASRRFDPRLAWRVLPLLVIVAALLVPALVRPAPAAAQVTAPQLPALQSASDLRTLLNLLLQEHTALAGNTTNAKIGGRDAEYRAASEALDMNSQVLGRFVGSLYGPENERTFLSSWRSHITAYDLYADGAMLNDAGRQQDARATLDAFIGDQDALFSTANPNLPPGLMAEQLAVHVDTTLRVIDAQAAQDFATVYALTKQGLDHAHMLGDPLAAATARQFPDRFPGDPTAPAATLRSAVNQLLQEHTLLAGNLSGAYLGGRLPEVQAVAQLEGQNGLQLASVIGEAYGPEAQTQFAQSWAVHLAQMTGLVDAIQKGDQAAQQQAMADMDAWVRDTSTWFGATNEALPPDQLANGLSAHGQALAAVAQAQAQNDWSTAYLRTHEATDHARTVSDTIVQATVQKYPQTFPN